MAVWGIAEETGGSIQNPAAAQSLVGVKTTQELISTDGVAPRSSSDTRDVLGPLAKTVRMPRFTCKPVWLPASLHGACKL
jgi:amidase